MRKWGLSIAGLMLIGLAGWVAVAIHRLPSMPAWVTLPDGSSLRIIAVTEGTNHVIGSKLGNSLDHWPGVFQSGAKRVLGQRALPEQKLVSASPEFVLWLDRQTNKTGLLTVSAINYNAFLGDGSNFVSGGEAYLNSFLIGSRLEQLHFPAFPHRDRIVTLNLYQQNAQGFHQLFASLPFTNPFYRDYPQWQSELLPATKRVGDLEVTLNAMETGHDSSVTTSWNKDGSVMTIFGINLAGGGNYTALRLKLKSLVNSNEVWRLTALQISDATGNNAKSSSMSWNSQTQDIAFMPSLWLSETAWKIRLEFKRSEGFHPDELFTLKSMPLGDLNQTTMVLLTTNIAGIPLTFDSILRRSPQTNQSWSYSQQSTMTFKHPAIPAGIQMDLLHVMWDTGETNLAEGWSWSDNQHDYHFRKIPLEARTADITFAVQKTRFVEFIVKPELPR